jgi:hypothetical protein
LGVYLSWLQAVFSHAIQGNLTGNQYIRDVLQPVVVPHFDNHPLATKPVYMDETPWQTCSSMSVCQQWTFNNSPWLKSRWFQRVSNCSCWQMSIWQPVLLGLKSRGVIKRPLLADRHRRTRLSWCLARRGWNLKTWRKIHWSDESRFLLHVTDGFGSQCCLSTRLVANGIRLTKRCNVLSSRSDVTRGLPDLDKSFTLLVCVFSHQSADYSTVLTSYSNNTGCPIDVCQQEQLETVWNQRDLSQGESLNVHCW